MQLRGVFKYRKNEQGKYTGNCFSVCVVSGAQLQGDPLVVGKKPELAIFPEKLLNSPKYTKELSVALKYLLENSYEVKIIDPDPTKDNLWGTSYKPELLDGEPRNYEESDINKYINDDWSVVFSTLSTNDKPHAILAFGNKLYDPECEFL